MFHTLIVTLVVWRKRGGPRCSVVSVHYFNKTTEHRTKQKTKTQSCKVMKNTKQKIITHNQNGENRLPKYDSQSETTIDSCL